MEIETFTKILNDQQFNDYRKMLYKYENDFKLFLEILDKSFYKKLPLLDFDNQNLVFIENFLMINLSPIKLLLQYQEHFYGFKAIEEEILSTSAIESIDFNRDSVRKILKGLAPTNEEENRILGMKRGFEFISLKFNKISEENLYKLYMMTIGDFLSQDDQLLNGNYYRHDSVYVFSNHIEHSGIDYKKIPNSMKILIEFINREDGINDLIKAAIIHFYIAFIHPYFDGNGRIARLIHLWFLIQKGYQSALFIPFSSQIEKTRKAYYDAFTLIEKNKKISGKIDVTPFILYFINNVYNKLNESSINVETFDIYNNAIKEGKITEKESKLWKFISSYYVLNEFSTKQLEKDYGDAAYATIRGFVLKFEQLGLLSSIKYGPRIKYKIVK